MRLKLVAAIVAVLATAAPAAAADVSVFCAGAVRNVVSALAPGYEAASGNRVVFTYGTVGALRDALAAGKRADVVLLSATALDAMQSAGTLAPGTRADLGRTGVGIAAKAGAPPIDVGSVASFRATMLAAASVAYPDPARGATSGKVIEDSFRRLGIADAMRSSRCRT